MMAITAAALVLAGISIWRLGRQKKDIYTFTEELEENLDALLAGEPLKNDQETRDTLSGKVNEKLARIQHIQERREQEDIYDFTGSLCPHFYTMGNFVSCRSHGEGI